MSASLVGSEMCIRDSSWAAPCMDVTQAAVAGPQALLHRRPQLLASGCCAAQHRPRTPVRGH
eukprot:7289385-Alexandrium_andersonii.AAC.1